MEWQSLLVLVMVVGLSEASCPQDPEQTQVVYTRDGAIRGVRETTPKGRPYFAFYGVPYGSPPVGRFRLKDPYPAGPWKGIREGCTVPKPCVQVPFLVGTAGIILSPEMLNGVEDCLKLNVFVPAGTVDILPVMVFIHGGGFYGGGAEEYIPSPILEEDVVVVVVQYRVGILGFMSTEDRVMPGNLGLKDQTLALRWVKDNIKFFGGDSNSITIFGESAGGASVHFQMLVPQARGLFSRVIMQSGTALNPFSLGRRHKEVALQVGHKFGCPTNQGSHALLKCLQTLDAKELEATVQDFFEWYIAPLALAPRVDGDYIPKDPNIMMRDGEYHQVDLMTGITSHEGLFVAYPLFFREELLNALVNNFSTIGPLSLLCCKGPGDPLEITTKVYNFYLGSLANLDPGTHPDEFIELYGDIHLRHSSDLTAELHAKRSFPCMNTFAYELQHRGQLSFGDFFVPQLSNDWVTHADDLFYLFRGGPILQPTPSPPGRPKDLIREVDLKVRDIMVKLWTNFAAYGDPTPDNSLGFTWKPVERNNFQYLSITTRPITKLDSRKKTRQFLKSLPTSQNVILHPWLVEN